ncbi:hypothetical protein Tco_0790845 [Tanacetum coccineum]
METGMSNKSLESRTFEVKMNQVLSENERLLAQAIDKDIVKTVVNLSVNASDETVNECQKCLELKTELLNKKDLVIFATRKRGLNQNAPSFTLVVRKLSELRAPSFMQRHSHCKLKEKYEVLKCCGGEVRPQYWTGFEIETLKLIGT